MTIEKIIAAYKQEFEYDPLFKKIKMEKLDNNLFSNEEYFSTVSFNDSYSSKKAAKLLGIDGKEQTLVNYIGRNDFNFYLNVYKQGRFYRYDWKSLFRFKMMFLLIDDRGYTPLDIAAIIGTVVESNSYPENNLKKIERINPSDFRNEHENTQELIESNNQQLTITINRMQDLLQKKYHTELEIKLNKERIWTLEGRIEDLKQYRDYQKKLANLNSNENFFTKLLGKNNKNQNEYIKENISNVQNKIDILNDSLKNIKAEKIALEEQVNLQNIKIESFKNAIENNNYKLEDTERDDLHVEFHDKNINIES